jgi:hypothetical protein
MGFLRAACVRPPDLSVAPPGLPAHPPRVVARSIWKAGSLLVYVLRREQYRPVPRSRLFPELDLDRLVSFIDLDQQTEAVRSWRAALRA